MPAVSPGAIISIGVGIIVAGAPLMIPELSRKAAGAMMVFLGSVMVLIGFASIIIQQVPMLARPTIGEPPKAEIGGISHSEFAEMLKALGSVLRQPADGNHRMRQGSEGTFYHRRAG